MTRHARPSIESQVPAATLFAGAIGASWGVENPDISGFAPSFGSITKKTAEGCWGDDLCRLGAFASLREPLESSDWRFWLELVCGD
jgi:hypothetical protein